MYSALEASRHRFEKFIILYIVFWNGLSIQQSIPFWANDGKKIDDPMYIFFMHCAQSGFLGLWVFTIRQFMVLDSYWFLNLLFGIEVIFHYNVTDLFSMPYGLRSHVYIE